eukprot:422022-Amphidinium_carterae.1
MGDSFHMDWNALRKALSRCDLYLLTLERCLLHNLPSGPWEGAGNHGQIRAAVDSFFKTHTSSDEVFGYMYDRLCRGFGDMPPDKGSSEHYESIFNRLQQAKSLKNKGERVRMGRWYDVFVKESRLQSGHWEALLFIL